MIVGAYTHIRTAEPDDAYAMRRLYRPMTPRACFLDRKRELTPATTDDLRELLQRKEVQTGMLYAVESLQGDIRGFGALRAAGAELAFGEIALMFPTEDDYHGPIIDELMHFLCEQAFMRKRMNKVIAHALDNEQALKKLLMEFGFASDGVQREMLFTRGRWFSLESFSLYSQTYLKPGAE